jgi:hypothetical protein
MTQTTANMMMPSAVGAALGVTDQTVRNWCRKGLAHRRDTEGTIWIDLEEAKRYKAQYTGHRHGGARKNAGRGGASGQSSKAPQGQGDDADGVLPLSAEAIEAQKQAEEAARAAGMLSTEAGIAASLAGAMSVEEANRRMQVLRALTMQLELDERLGKLVKIEECRDEWMGLLIGLRTRLEALGPRLAPNIVSALKLDREQQNRLTTMIGNAVRTMLEELANDPLCELVKRK